MLTPIPISVNQIGVILSWTFQTASLVFALVAAYGVWRRFWWGEESHVQFKQLPDIRERKWSYGSNEDYDGLLWSNYIHLLVTNHGWWTGVIWNIDLTHVILDGERVDVDPNSDVFDILIESYVNGEQDRIDLSDPHSRVGRNLIGRDNTHLKLVLFLNQAGKLARRAEEAEGGEFHFLADIQDNKGHDEIEFSVDISVADVQFDR